MGTHYQGARREVRALDTYIKLLRAAESVSNRMSRHLAEHELTLSQFGVLEILLHLGPRSQRELGQKLLKSSGNVTMVVDNLEKQGLVRRQRETKDRRVVTVHLTGEGRRLIQELFPHHLTGIVAEMEILSAQEQEALGRLCRKVGLRR